MFTLTDVVVGSGFDGGGDVVPLTSPLRLNSATPLAFSLSVTCHSGSLGSTAFCPTNENDPHFTFNVWVSETKCAWPETESAHTFVFR